MLTSIGRGGTGARSGDPGAHRRAEVYSDEALWRARYDHVTAERDLWKSFAALARFGVPVPRGEVASAYAPSIDEKPPTVVRIPWQRVAPDGVPGGPKVHNPRRGQR